MNSIIVNIDDIREDMYRTMDEFRQSYTQIKMDDTQCRIWIDRLERLNRKLAAGAAAIFMADDEAVDGDDVDGLDGMGDINGNLLMAITFNMTQKHVQGSIANLERRERELRGVVMPESED